MPRKYRPKMRRRRRRRRQTIPRSISTSLVPQSRVVKMRYVDYGSLNVDASGFAAGAVFRWNSIHDPNFSGGSGNTQPYGHDIANQMYAHYEVLGAKATVTFSSRVVATATEVLGVALSTRDVTTLDVDGALIRERPRTRYGWLRGLNGGGLKTLSLKWSAKTIPNRDPQTASADFGADPSQSQYLHLYALPDASGEDESVCLFNIQIDYIVKLTEPLDLSKS